MLEMTYDEANEKGEELAGEILDQILRAHSGMELELMQLVAEKIPLILSRRIEDKTRADLMGPISAFSWLIS